MAEGRRDDDAVQQGPGDALGEIRDATTPTYRPDVLFNDVPDLFGPSVARERLTSPAPLAPGTVTAPFDVPLDVRIPGSERIRPPVPVPFQGPAEPEPGRGDWPLPNIPTMGVPRSPQPLGRTPRAAEAPGSLGREPRTTSPVKSPGRLPLLRAAVVAVALLVILGGERFGGITSAIDSVKDRFGISSGSVSGGSGGDCVPTLDEPGVASPEADPGATPPGGELPTPAASVGTVRFEVVSSAASSARVSVYGDTPDMRSCEVDLPWANEAPVDGADSLFVSAYGSGQDGPLACRIYLDDVLMVESVSGSSGVDCVTHVNDLVEAPEDTGGEIGDLVAVPPVGAAAPALPTENSLELQVEGNVSTIDLETQLDSGAPTSDDGVPLPTTQEVSVPAAIERVAFRAGNFREEGALLRCRLLVGGVQVAQETSLRSVRCRTSLTALGLR